MENGNLSCTVSASWQLRPLLTDSNLTDQDRRQVRHLERSLLNEIKENFAELAELESNKFVHATNDIDEMYQQVCYPREGNLDGLCLDELDAVVGTQAALLSGTDMTKFKAADLISASDEACVTDSEFDWETLGDAVGSCFRSVPETNFTFGLMDTVVAEKTKKKPRRSIHTDENAPEAQPRAYNTKQKDIKDAQARRLSNLETAIEREPGQKASLFDVILDSSSFKQTVENLFDTSFLVHSGSLEIGVDDSTGLPFLEKKEDPMKDAPNSEQSIISITPAQWEELVNAYCRGEPLVGHRT